MDNDQREESEYLAHTIELLEQLLVTEEEKLSTSKKKMAEANREMYENTIHHTEDFTKLTEMNVYLQDVTSRTFDYNQVRKTIARYLRLLDSPYFGRVDFHEDGLEETEKIYIGKGSVIDPEEHTFRVYDWRAPISSMFYRYEPGPASYHSPDGQIQGQITLKRQYKVSNSQLEFFFDNDVQVRDEMLQLALGRNASPKMRTIIETIQREQDIIIRDSESDLLIVQGAAGSGKTSIVLHRIAFLLYEGLSAKLTTKDILILSPNLVFSNYISNVLPELGEENVKQVTMEALVKDCCKDIMGKKAFPGRNEQIEACMIGRDDMDGETITAWVQFKSSATFLKIINRYLYNYEHSYLFEDVYYGNKTVAKKGELKNTFINDKTGMPLAKRLLLIKTRLQGDINEIKKRRLKKLETIVEQADGHDFEIQSYSRLLLMKDDKKYREHLKQMTTIDVIALYKGLFSDKLKFEKLAQGLELPADIDKLFYATQKSKKFYFEDWVAIAYLKCRVIGHDTLGEIRHVVIDEVQDYYPMQLALIKELYGTARFTVVGDIAQALERTPDETVYDQMPIILGKKKPTKLSLYRSYRSSYEINEFAKKITNGTVQSDSFPRHEEHPTVCEAETEREMDQLMINRLKEHLDQGFETVAILCKTMAQAKLLYNRLRLHIKIKLIVESDDEISHGCFIMPVYFAKGLEFDAVLIHAVDDKNYCSTFDMRVLYIACTRALHRLSVYYRGKASKFLN
jgi:DNA helicase-2/ATP-dependent DNA helicase PcrA